MPRPLSLRAAVTCVAVGCLPVLVLSAVPQEARQPQQPTFRAGVTAVPVDVRVIDRAGRPVTDLKQEDFVVFEDDVRQTVIHFSRQLLEAQPPGPAVRARADMPVFDATRSPQPHRVFLIVLGSGAIGDQPLISVSPSGAVHGPRTLWPFATKVVDGLIHFVRDRLLPQDQVALLAYNRATDFSTDHEAVARLLEQCKESPEAGAAAMAQQRVGLPDAAAMTGQAETMRAAADAVSPLDLGFGEYVGVRSGVTNELGTVRYGLKYLRYMEGEKHLLWVTANGLMQPTPGSLGAASARERGNAWVEPTVLAAEASDARVAVHPIKSGGLSENAGQFVASPPIMSPSVRVPGVASWGAGSSGASSGAPVERSASADPHSVVPTPGWDRPAPAPPVPIPGLNAATMQALADLRQVASLTGGRMSAMTLTATAADRIDSDTRANYVLAYYPSNSAFDGRYRNVRVEVNRPDTTVFYRHGYYARQQAVPLNRRDVVIEGRFAAAAASTRDVADIHLAVTPTFSKDRSGDGGEVQVEVLFDGARLAWATDELSRRVAHLEIGVFCGDARQNVVGQWRRTLDIALTEERFKELGKRGLPYAVRVPVERPPRFVKVIVFNYESNLAGSATVRMK